MVARSTQTFNMCPANILMLTPTDQYLHSRHARFAIQTRIARITRIFMALRLASLDGATPALKSQTAVGGTTAGGKDR